ncbi:hypothetical protein [Lentzea terrae]|uniref:hypothetical protein n=1 Tax=Lentzea terrae TaxID=2200761 RepID=UPI0013004C03|nr:hypothetical protein [Lentzea terrae]
MILPKEAPSTISVVEEFFGEGIELGVAQRVLDTPLYQLVELADRLVEHNRRLQRALSRRCGSAFIHKDYEVFAKIDRTIHDRIYLHGYECSDLVDDPDLNHLLLFSAHTILPDRTLDWAEETAFLATHDQMYPVERVAVELAGALESITPLAALIRKGYVVPVATKEVLVLGHHRDDGGNGFPLSFSTEIDDYANPSIFWQDPYLAWLLVKKLECIPSWELDALDLSDPTRVQEAASYYLDNPTYNPDVGRFCREAIVSAHPNATIDQIRDAVQIGFLHRESRAMPMVSCLTGVEHLTRSTKVLLDGSAVPFDHRHESELRSISYRTPSLRHVSTSDMVKLRLQEDLYEEVRRSMEELLRVAQNSPTPAGYLQFKSLIESCAEDVVRPTYERLSKQASRAKLGTTIGGLGAGGMVSLAINAISALVPAAGALIARSTANPAGNIAKGMVEKRIGKKGRIAETEIACSILLSVLPPTVRR